MNGFDLIIQRPRAFGVAALIALASPTAAQDRQDTTFINTEGDEIGTATLTGTSAGLLIELDLEGLPQDSWHGFHIHENGECDAQDGFKTAGGHFAISGTNHGFFIEKGRHAGDMPNQYVTPEGRLKAEVLNSQAFLGGELDNVSGRALILHSGVDDYKSQPSGESGDRIACAVIE